MVSWVTHSPRNTEDVGSNAGTNPLSLGPIPSGRLKNFKDIDKLSPLSLSLSVRGMSVISELDCTCTVCMIGHIVL